MEAAVHQRQVRRGVEVVTGKCACAGDWKVLAWGMHDGDRHAPSPLALAELDPIGVVAQARRCWVD